MARLRSSRSSAARSEGGKQLLRRVDDRVRMLVLEARAVVDPPPRHRDRSHAGRLRRPDVERRVADVHRLARRRPEALGGDEQRLRVGLVPLGLVPAHDRVEHVPERNVLEGELHRRAALGRDDTEPAPLAVEALENTLHARTADELLVQGLVVRAVDGHELVDALRVERPHLRLEPRAADRPQKLLVRVLAAEDLPGRVPHRSKDDAARVDDGAVEIEEDEGLARHHAMVSACPTPPTSTTSSSRTPTGTASGTSRSRSSASASRPSSTACWTPSSTIRPSPRSRSTGRRSCSRTTSTCVRRTPTASARSSPPAASKRGPGTSSPTRSSSVASRSCATSCSAAGSAAGSASSPPPPGTSRTASATRRSCRSCSPASASARSCSRAAWATRSTTSASSSAGGRPAAR